MFDKISLSKHHKVLIQFWNFCVKQQSHQNVAKVISGMMSLKLYQDRALELNQLIPWNPSIHSHLPVIYIVSGRWFSMYSTECLSHTVYAWVWHWSWSKWIVNSASDDQLCIQDHICILHVFLKQKEGFSENSSLQETSFFFFLLIFYSAFYPYDFIKHNV